MKIEYLITLLETPRIGRKSAQYIADNINGSSSSIKELLCNIENLKAKYKRLQVPKYSDLQYAYEKAENILNETAKSNIQILSKYSSGFPKNLLNIPDGPLVLYIKGNSELLLENKAVAVIGTRQPSEIGLKLGKRITELFVESQLVIVSGLAIGCDTIAHQTCINSEGQTIAVLPSGINNIYPKKNRNLADSIIENKGLLLSEYKVNEKARNNYFIERDRLQSGLSKGICVIETEIKGGTMHTVGFAEKQGRLIGCINHPIHERIHPKAIGNQMLIREKRAIPLGSPKDIESFIGMLKQFNNLEQSNSNNGQFSIF